MSQSQADVLGDVTSQSLPPSRCSTPSAWRYPIIGGSTVVLNTTPSVSSSQGALAETSASSGSGTKKTRQNRISKMLGKVFRTEESRKSQQVGLQSPPVVCLGGGPGNTEAIADVSDIRSGHEDSLVGITSSSSAVMVTETRPVEGGDSPANLGEMITKIAPSELNQDKDAEDYEKLAATLGRGRLILQELKEIAGASDFLAPFKAFFGFTDSILRMMESVEATEKKWKDLRDDIVDHLTYVRDDLKDDSSVKVLGSDSPRLKHLKQYAKELTGVFNTYLVERGLSGDNVAQESTAFTEYVKEAGRYFKKASTITLDTAKISSLQGRLAKAFQNYERSKTAYIANRQSELWDAMIAELLRGNRSQQPFGGSASEETISPSGMQHSKCHPGTRNGIRASINQWADASEGQPIYLICDHAGMGKSTIAHQLACDWHESGRLAASFFFSRGTVGTSSFADLIRHVAGRLWGREEVRDHHEMTYKYIVDALDESRSTKEQWERLVLRPLSILASGSAEDSPPLLLVIDAVDECNEISRQALLSSINDLLDVTSLSYGRIKLLVTGRPEPDLMGTFKNSTLKIEDLMSQDVDGADVETYVKDRFDTMGLSREEAQRMSRYADGLFIFAATACGLLIKSKARGRLLDRILDKETRLHMDRLTALYINILRTKLDTDECSKEAIQNVLRIVLAATRPLLASEIDQLLSDEGVNVADTIEDFMSVLGGGSGDIPVYVRHPTFREFMLDSKVSEEHGGVTIESAHQLLTLCCLTKMKGELKFNICGLETSTLSNSEILGLDTRVQQKISNALQYSCLYWPSHLFHNVDRVSTGISVLLEKLFSGEHLLFWLEVLSLMRKVPVAVSVLQQMKTCAKKFPDLAPHVMDDALHFVIASYTPISTSAPHIYLSGLPFIPTESKLWKVVIKSFPNLLDVCKGRMKHWANRPIEWRGHTDHVRSVAYSPDGRHVVSGSRDQMIRIWDAETGLAVGEPLVGHNNSVLSVAYSPDGRRIVSGSSDHTIRIWDAETRVAVDESLTGHHNSVLSVAYSPDGKQVVSGSSDQTIRIWDADTGETVGDPLTGHTGYVLSVAYSPDGRYVISGSEDKSIRIWDTKTQSAVGEPWKGHAGYICSVTYSPDGRHVISGSSDKTIRIWDANTGEAVGEPLAGHTGGILSVACSPDGRYIVSASSDHTILVWNAETGTAEVGPLTGHAGYVWSVAYSPNGQDVISGSSDRAIRVWDAETGAAMGEPLTGHTGYIWSVTYSHDGRHVISGSSDKTIRIWDVNTGEAVGEPLAGHEDGVWSVACSSNGRHVVSGSFDRTIRIWDTETRKVVGRPMMGHTDWVRCVAYSPDGRHIVSGSSDQTIRIWDAETGEMVNEPLSGHTGWVRCVAYSPDSRHIVSGSEDRTIRIWGAEIGEATGGPLTGHAGNVNCVAYSPNGRYIVSGSFDRTVRIWDAETRMAVGGPFMGHTDLVRGVAYSPDGRNVVSCSSDRTVRIWDAGAGVTVGEPFTGHTDWVRCVAYSPDGRHIVSGSFDCTIRIWDVETGAAMGEPLAGYSGSGSRVAHLPDKEHVVPGSSYKEIGIWDTEMGEVVGESSMGHKGFGLNAAYPPDGRHVVSGSFDQAIQTRDMVMGVANQSMRRHSGELSSVAQSPGSQTLVSTSEVLTVRIWDRINQNTGGDQDAALGSMDRSTRLWDVRNPFDTSRYSLTTLSGFPIPRKLLNPTGWVCGAEGLLFWVPEDCRNGLTSAATVTIPSTGHSRSVRLDFTRFLYGGSWADVFARR